MGDRLSRRPGQIVTALLALAFALVAAYRLWVALTTLVLASGMDG